jgi:hypothetical protein
VHRFALHSATLDDVFLALTGHAATRPDSVDSAGGSDSATRSDSLTRTDKETAGV